MTTAANW